MSETEWGGYLGMQCDSLEIRLNALADTESRAGSKHEAAMECVTLAKKILADIRTSISNLGEVEEGEFPVVPAFIYSFLENIERMLQSWKQ